MSAGDEPAHECRLFLRLPAQGNWKSLIETLPATLAKERPASVLLPPIEVADLEAARQVVTLIQQADIAALVRDDVGVALQLAADGLHLADAGKCREVRKRLGPELALGVQCLPERDAAIQAGEDGADYVAFALTAANEAETRELLAWWHEMMVLPAVALIEDTGIDTDPIKALADFISPPC